MTRSGAVVAVSGREGPPRVGGALQGADGLRPTGRQGLRRGRPAPEGCGRHAGGSLGLLIDTDLLIDRERGAGTPEIEAVLGDEERAISVITVSELLHGALRGDAGADGRDGAHSSSTCLRASRRCPSQSRSPASMRRSGPGCGAWPSNRRARPVDRRHGTHAWTWGSHPQRGGLWTCGRPAGGGAGGLNGFRPAPRLRCEA